MSVLAGPEMHSALVGLSLDHKPQFATIMLGVFPGWLVGAQHLYENRLPIDLS